MNRKIKDRNIRQEQFQREHKEYMQEKRKEFLLKFEESVYEEKINSTFIDLMHLNQMNQHIISKFRYKCNGQKSPKLRLNKCEVDLYSNEEKKSMLQRINTEFYQITDLVNMPQPNSKSLDLKNYRQAYLYRTIEYNNSKNNGINKIEDKTINSWLQLTTKLTFQLQIPIKISFQTRKGDKKSKDNLVQQIIIPDNIMIEDKQREETRHSLGNSGAVNVSGSSRFRRQIIGCFSRKRIKQMLEGQRISPMKKANISVQKSNTTLILPSLSINSGNSQNNKNEINLNLSNRYKHEEQIDTSSPKRKSNLAHQQNLPLKQLVAKKMQSQKQQSQNPIIKRNYGGNNHGSIIKAPISHF